MVSYDSPGSPMDPEDHPAHNVPQATQHYAGDVLPMPGDRSMGSGETYGAEAYALGQKTDPKVSSIGRAALKSWTDKTIKRLEPK